MSYGNQLSFFGRYKPKVSIQGVDVGQSTTMTSVLRDEEGVENTATLIIRNDNPDFDLLLSEYSQTVKFLSQKPND